MPPANLWMKSRCICSIISYNELKTIAGLSHNCGKLAEGKFTPPHGITQLRTLLARNLARFTRTFKYDKRVTLWMDNRAVRMQGTAAKVPALTEPAPKRRKPLPKAQPAPKFRPKNDRPAMFAAGKFPRTNTAPRPSA